MSKVYSFRLNEKNPREAQTMKVIEAWVGEGYLLRFAVVEALLSYQKFYMEQSELVIMMENLQELILSMNKNPHSCPTKATLSNTFIYAVRQSIRSGLSTK